MNSWPIRPMTIEYFRLERAGKYGSCTFPQGSCTDESSLSFIRIVFSLSQKKEFHKTNLLHLITPLTTGLPDSSRLARTVTLINKPGRHPPMRAMPARSYSVYSVSSKNLVRIPEAIIAFRLFLFLFNAMLLFAHLLPVFKF